MQKAILQLMETIERNKQKTTGRMVRTLSEAARREKDSGRVSDYYFDYNTVEQVLIACSIFLSLVAIMFESGQFYQINPQTGMKEPRNDPTTEAFYTAVLVMGGTVLIGSLVYYAVVFMAEVIGHVPGFIRMLFASKKTRMQKKRERSAAYEGINVESFRTMWSGYKRKWERTARGNRHTYIAGPSSYFPSHHAHR